MDFFFQFKIKMYAKKNINLELNRIDNFIQECIIKLNNSWELQFINSNNYNIKLSILETIIDDFNKITKPYSFKHDKISTIRTKINNIKLKLNTLIETIGINTLFSLFEITLGIKPRYYFKEEPFIEFLNTIFSPLNYKIYKKNNLKSTNSDLIIYNKNNEIKSIEYYDLNIIEHLQHWDFQNLFKSSSIKEYNDCSRFYIEFKDTILVLDGVFINDTLNLYRKHFTLKTKLLKLKKEIKAININKQFKNGFIEQLSLKDIITYKIKDIINICYSYYNKIIKLKQNNISNLVKEFLNSDSNNQRIILTLFLLMKDDIETQYLAYLMFDLINNDSYLLKSSKLSNVIYSSLHWSIKKIFKIAIKNIEQNTNKLLNFNESDISYENRIGLMKTSDFVKHKAIEKLKEIENKGGENSSKAQQYLDGLLKIPFGIYRYESIIIFLTDFRKEIMFFTNDFINIYSEDTTDIVKNILNLILNFKKNKSKFIKTNVINIFFKEFNDIITIKFSNELLKHYNHVFVNIKNLKKIKIIEIIKNLNIVFKKYNLNEISISGKKNDIITNLQSNINLEKFNSDNNLILELIKNIDESYYDKINKIYTNNSFVNRYYKLEEKWNIYKNERVDYLNDIKNILNNTIYSQDVAKKEILRIIAQWINGESKGYCLGFEGPPGTGKTTLAKKGISSCLKNEKGETRPFAFIALGGSTNGSILEGHSYTYVGSTWGKIVDILMETKCMNPIIYVDELDKISKTEHGKEIIGILTHLTDSSQNDEFYDKYFSGIKIDLSKVLFIFSYNDFSKLDPILADRIHRVKFKNLSKNEKVHIINNYILPELLDQVGFTEDSITLDESVLLYIMNNYTYEAGIRNLKQKLFEIIREINLNYLMNPNKYKLPISITQKMVENIFYNKLKILYKKINEKPHVGLVNGLYATGAGIGGITIIEACKTPNDNKLNLMLTGQQGDVMKESVQCSKTIAWNIIPQNIKDKINKELEINKWGIHIHCPEAATPKDGPSAGGAITLAIISLLTGIPVNNKIALTGEIDLNGNIHVIGGLEHKIEGGKIAGATTILYPADNQQDIEIIKKNNPDILLNINIKPIKNIWQVLNYCLLENDIQFITY